MNMSYEQLTDEEKQKYKQAMIEKFGYTFVFSETGEPLYFDEQGRRIVTDIELLSSIETNPN